MNTKRRMISAAATLAASTVVMVVGPPTVLAGGKYSGDLVPPHVGYGTPSAIEFNVSFGKNKKGKVVPTSVKRFRSRSVTMYCANGNAWWLGWDPAGGTTDWQDHPTDWVDVKKRKFHDATDGEYGPSSGFYEITGTIPKNGPATGTIRMSYPNAAQGGYCDSGVLNWSASPVG
jgi:hypothetical protein